MTSAQALSSLRVDLSGQTALVTGASQGLGLAMAQRLAGAGAKVTCVARSADKLAAVVQSIRDAGGTAEALTCDVTDSASVDKVVEDVVTRWERLDILVNNAGIALGAQFEDTTDEQYDRIFAINVRSMFRLSRAAVPHLRARGRGRIINLGSIMSSTGGPMLSVYGATKHAVAGLTKGMAVDLGKYGITVNYLQPGSIYTALSAPFFEDEAFRKYWEQKAPVGRIGQPADVAAAALFLASSEADFVSGAGLAVDGGAGVNF